MRQDIFIVDDFYNNPDDVVDYANQLEWTQEAGRNHFMRTVGIPDVSLIPYLEEITGHHLIHDEYAWTSTNDVENFNCSYYKLVQGDEHTQPNWIHHDWTTWTGMIYLSKDVPAEYGTSLWRHKPTGQDATKWRSGYYPDGGNENDWFDPLTKNHKREWEKTDTFAYKYNRLVLFKGSMYHSVNVPDGPAQYERLNQLLYFNSEEG